MLSYLQLKVTSCTYSIITLHFWSKPKKFFLSRCKINAKKSIHWPQHSHCWYIRVQEKTNSIIHPHWPSSFLFSRRKRRLTKKIKTHRNRLANLCAPGEEPDWMKSYEFWILNFFNYLERCVREKKIKHKKSQAYAFILQTASSNMHTYACIRIT